MKRILAVATLLALAPALSVAQPHAVSVRETARTVHDRAPRVHDRGPHIHNNTPVARS